MININDMIGLDYDIQDCLSFISNFDTNLNTIKDKLDSKYLIENYFKVDFEERANNDIICFSKKNSKHIFHVGLLLDKNSVIHTENKVLGVKIDNIEYFNFLNLDYIILRKRG